MIIENIKTGQRFEIADGAHFPETAYRIVDAEPTIESILAPEPEPTPEPKPEPKPKPAKAKKTITKKKPAAKKRKK